MDPRKKPRAKGQALLHSFLVPATCRMGVTKAEEEEPAHGEQRGFRLMLKIYFKKCYV